MKKSISLAVAAALLTAAVGTASADEGTSMWDEVPSENFKGHYNDALTYFNNNPSFLHEGPIEIDPNKETILIYMIGADLEWIDGDITKEGAASKDIYEMIKSSENGNCDNLNIIIAAGGSYQWYMPGIGSDKVSSISLFQVKDGGLRSDKDKFDGSMVAGENITKVLSYVFKDPNRGNTLPGKKSVIFWDHGGGAVFGYGKDVFDKEETAISSKDLAAAIGNAGVGKFNWIGFDACYMADRDTAQYLKDCADYLIASQDKESWVGWNYEFLKDIGLNQQMSDADEAASVISHYEAFHKKYTPNAPLTLSCIPLGENMKTIDDAIGAYMAALGTYLADESKAELVAQARLNTKEFDLDPDAVSYRGGKKTVDIYDLAINTKNLLWDEASQNIINTIEGSILYNAGSAENSKAHGLSAAFKYETRTETKESTDQTQEEINKFVKSYNEAKDKFQKAHEEIGKVNASADQNQYSLQLSTDQHSICKSGRFWVLRRNNDGTYSKVLVKNGLRTDENGLITTSYDNMLPKLKSSGLTYDPCLQYENGMYTFLADTDTGTGSDIHDYGRTLKVELMPDGEIVSAARYGSTVGKAVDYVSNGIRLAYTVENYRDRTADSNEVPLGDVVQGQNIRRALTTNDLSFEVKELDKEHDYFGMFEIDNVYDMPQFYSGLIPISAKTEEKKAVGAREFGTGQINMKNMKLCGVNITLPIKYSEFVKKGFTCSQLDGTDIKISPNQKLYATAYSKDGSCVSIMLGNGGTGAVDYSQADVIGIFASDNSGFDNAMTSKKITETGLGRSAASDDRGSFTVYRYALGSDSVIPTLHDDGTTDGGEHDHAALYVDNATGEIKAVGVSVSPGRTAGSSKNNASGGVPAGWKYTNPSGLGNELLSFNFSLDGRVYNLPLPMNRLTDSGSGWKAQSGVKVKGHNEIMTPLTKGDSTIFVLAANYNDSEADLDKCICTGIRLTENSKANMKLPGGVSAESIPEINNSSFSRVGTPENRWYVYEGSDSEYEEVMRLKKDELFLYRTVKTYKLYGDTTQTGVMVYPY